MTEHEKILAQVEILDSLVRWSEQPGRPAEMHGVLTSVDLRLRAVALLAQTEEVRRSSQQL